MKRNFGFSLVELLITVAIITILMAIAIPAYTNFVAKGRDSKRRSDLKTLQSALTQYRADQGSYPISLIPGQPLANPTNTQTYLQRVPIDPLTTYGEYPQYVYVAKPNSCNNTTTRCTAYCLYANLEDGALTDRSSVCPDSDQYNLEIPSP
jgi:type II secretion system protein G